jgi:hypothetical protein
MNLELLIVILTVVIIVGVVLTMRRLDTISHQLSNIYVLKAWGSVPDSCLDSCSVWTVECTENLNAWAKMNQVRFLSKGMTLDAASSAASDLFFETHGRWIAQFAPSRVTNGCRTKKNGELCPDCAKTFTYATTKWDELMAKEKTTGKLVTGSELIIGIKECPQTMGGT